MAAEGYARIAGHIGVLQVTTGPGGTNSITGVCGAWIDSIPMLVVSGQIMIKDMIGDAVTSALPKGWMPKESDFLVNPTGNFVVGGPDGDCGLTGRKIIVDTYGGAAPHGGGAFSGKDPTKVDRSAAYMGRWVAKNIVAAKLAERCEVQFAYAIGHPDPVVRLAAWHDLARKAGITEAGCRRLYNFGFETLAINLMCQIGVPNWTP